MKYSVIALLICCLVAPYTDAKTISIRVKKQHVEWGEWNKKRLKKRYGVGVKGKVQSQINQLDQSNLLDNADGVAIDELPANLKKKKRQRKNIKAMLEELEAMERQVEKEIDDDRNF